MAEVPRKLKEFFSEIDQDQAEKANINLDDLGPNDLVLLCKLCEKPVKSQKGVTSNFYKHVRVSSFHIFIDLQGGRLCA